MYHQSGEFIWSLLVVVWAICVLILLSRCSYYLKKLLMEIKARVKVGPQ
jgi:hypothetical protein